MRLGELAEKVSGKLIGDDAEFRGRFTTLGGAREGDVVIRHWIDDKGVKIASEKGVSAIITQDPRGEASELHEVPLILVDRIEVANAFALSWSVKNFAPSSRRVIVTGTNGKSTTTHMITHILRESGRSAYTNTDSRSEFNTLIDPVVSQQISESGSPEFLIIEVSEVQGWLGRVMRDHAYMMASAVEPEMAVITNVAMDHIGLVDSLDDVFREVSGAVRALKEGVAVLNADDPRVREMADINPHARAVFYGSGTEVRYDEGIYCGDELLVSPHELPLRGEHFIQNTLAAVAACRGLRLSLDDIRDGVRTYRPLKRRFSVLMEKPLVIDDFAHNPDGIRSTVRSALKTLKGRLWVVNAIRGSRGEEINLLNAGALAESLKGAGAELIVTASSDLVDKQNTVLENERRAFLGVLEDNGIEYRYIETLRESLKTVLDAASPSDTVLLLGAQGMDPASKVLKEIMGNS
ncbi:MAG: Mur ligase family protein [Methanothermobacter wolfeii]|nr:Mur ligase family protein [Methanothermobacter wolfeii]